MVNAFKTLPHVQLDKIAHILVSDPAGDYFLSLGGSTALNGCILVFADPADHWLQSLNCYVIIELLLDILDADTSHFPAGTIYLLTVPDSRKGYGIVGNLLLYLCYDELCKGIHC